jgi:hypothetical protein
MAGRAILRRAGKAIVDVALAAGDCSVLAGKRELGCGVMVVLRALPLRRVVAGVAGGRESGRLVVRVR